MLNQIPGINRFDHQIIEAMVDPVGLTNDLVDAIVQYLFLQLDPGSFFRAVLANDFAGAMKHAHPILPIPALKALVLWMDDYVPGRAMGSYHAIKEWMAMDPEETKKILVANGCRLKDEDIVMLELSDE